MKRYWNIYNRICDLDNIKKAHQMARKWKWYYKEVKIVDSNIDYYCKQIQKMLINKTYSISEDNYTTSIIQDWQKERELWKLKYYPHRIIQRAIMLQLEPIFMKVFCNHTCASLKWRWIHHAHKLTRKYSKQAKYCLKIDIRKFYPTINHDILKQLLAKKIKCKDTLNLLWMIIDSYPWEKWVPIGSYLSQYLANYYLAYFDHWLKENKRCKYVVRYMDDIIILDNSKNNLHKLLKDMDNYLKELKLEIKDNYQIFPIKVRWIDFVWYRFFWDYILLRKNTCNRFKKVTKRKENNRWRCWVNSYIWWLLWCNSYRLYEKYIKPIIDKLVAFYDNIIRWHRNYKNKLLKKQFISY